MKLREAVLASFSAREIACLGLPGGGMSATCSTNKLLVCRCTHYEHHVDEFHLLDETDTDGVAE